MSKDNTASLIEELVESHCAVNCTRHPLICSSGAMMASIAYITVVVLFIGARPDFFQALQAPVFLFEFILMFAVFVSAALASAWLRVPDMRGQQWVIAIPLTLLASFMLWQGVRIFDEGITIAAIHWHHCFQDASLMGLVPVAVMVMTARQGNTAHPLMMSFMNVLSVAALGYVGLRITCAADTLEHIGPYHLLPYLIIGGVLGLVARRIYKW